ncbi:MmgE/PrpD family protein [Paraburkholderia ginsengisoli]|uniref:MmgE/PrpD family protein n=1 Tax=Paraburkholderia ginsengisoli TaxID=311231 RepID=A0A7T4N357_9BURK|nr:MmgE/PrpD family protein [Paraburkholderia ginsengisoli]QQC64386.1 MmgE/PrpD family protein [Paraburkholderia ginsengisoli]
MTLEKRIAKYLIDATPESVGPRAIHTAHSSLIDILGVTSAGASDPEVNLLADIVEQWGGAEQCRVLGRSRALPAPAAALLNGAASRVFDFDDVVDSLGTHPSVAIFPPLLAVAELSTKPVNGLDFLTAFAIGQDLSVRFAKARHETLLESGRYDLSKVIAATAAAGKLFGLGEDALINAMGIAYTSALGETQCMIDGTSSVFYQQGLTASNAIKAILLAAAGFTGANRFLTGRWGYYSAFEPGSNLTIIEDRLGTDFTNIDHIAFKPYPTCRPNTSAVALAHSVADQKIYRANDIDRIEVRTNKQIRDLVCLPIEQKQSPTSVVEARFSVAYNVATALHTGDLFISDFTKDAIRREEILAISRKVHSLYDPECEDVQLGAHGKIKIAIYLKNGKCMKGTTDYPKGNPKNPMTSDEIDQKFIKCLKHTGNTRLIEKSCEILSLLHRFPRGEGTVSDLTSLL